MQNGVRGAKELQKALNSKLTRGQKAGYVFQVRQAYRYYKQGQLYALEFKTQPGNPKSPRIDIRLKNGQRIEAKSWKGWRSQEDLSRIGDPSVVEAIQESQQKRLARLDASIREYLRTPGSKLRVEFDQRMPHEVRQLLQQLKGGFGNRLTWKTIP